MKKTILITILLVSVQYSKAQKKIEYIYPATEFNYIEIAEILDNTGSGTIKSKAILKGKPVGYFMKVSLFPVTDYFAEYLYLEKKYGRKGKKRASITPEALSYRIITKVDGNNGSAFEFTNLKQGKYYIEGYLNVVKEKKGTSFVGQDSYTFEGNLISGPPIFQEFSYNKFNGYYISGTAEITREGQLVEATISN
ncbi:MAG: hypothetical protein R2814_12400 [Flavobacteriaceae bacterium]